MMQQQKHLSLHFTQPAPSKLQIFFVEIEKTVWFNIYWSPTVSLKLAPVTVLRRFVVHTLQLSEQTQLIPECRLNVSKPATYTRHVNKTTL